MNPLLPSGTTERRAAGRAGAVLAPLKNHIQQTGLWPDTVEALEYLTWGPLHLDVLLCRIIDCIIDYHFFFSCSHKPPNLNKTWPLYLKNGENKAPRGKATGPRSHCRYNSSKLGFIILSNNGKKMFLA